MIEVVLVISGGLKPCFMLDFALICHSYVYTVCSNICQKRVGGLTK